ncbi:hypothetical protein SA47_1286 [Salmonella enterica subsp. enterica serovar Agona str. 47.E.09]|nr:hypothetical protein SA47_1286 [Salmonella enterica subsp. enterica serovar Agona str. 47.E.09]
MASCHTSLGESMLQGLVASHGRRVLYYLVVGGNHWQPSPMPKVLKITVLRYKFSAIKQSNSKTKN